MARPDLRRSDEMRKVKLTANVNAYGEASVLAEIGANRVLCVATVEKEVPPACKSTGGGWITAEYGILPMAQARRQPRGSQDRICEQMGEKISQALRAAVDLSRMNACTIRIDCDVLQADGDPVGAAMTGAATVLCLAFRRRMDNGYIRRMPMQTQIAAVSAGICQGEPVLDLSDREREACEVAVEIFMTGSGEIVDMVRLGEGRPFTKAEMEKLLSLCKKGTGKLCREEKKITGELA